jgi:hypothetical protein
MSRYNLTQRVPIDYVTIKTASQITGMTANAIRVAGYNGRIDMVRAGSGGWAADRRHHNEVSLQSLWDYITNRDPRGRKPKAPGLRNVSGGGAGK